MKIILGEEDREHTFDIDLSNQRLYDGVRTQLVPPNRARHPREREFVGDQNELSSIIRNNALGILMGMPSDYVIVTGIAPNWVRSGMTILAQQLASTAITSDGRNAMIMFPAPPPLRLLAGAQVLAWSGQQQQ